MQVKPQPAKLALLISALFMLNPPLHAQPTEQDVPAAAESADGRQPEAAELSPVVVTGQRTRDEAGHDAVYEKDISNVYVDRQYMERYRGVSVGDALAGMNGVYNTDNRNGAALFPNIRGLSGNGRIPVTVDGTVQSIDVWMGRQGINNRNYVDPNLFRSIEVEKGPSMTRGLKSGIGGSVNIRTIDAEDIIGEGKNWGLELKLGTASNSIKDSTDAHSLAGKDYRDIPGAVTAAPLGTPGLLFIEPQDKRRSRNDTRLFNMDDRKLFLSGAYRHDVFDVLAAYSNTRRGNYFAGKKGASDYMQNERTNPTILNSTKGMYPNIARLFAPGWEVPYTSTELESLLLKTNWKLPDGQKLSFSYTRNDLNFAELPSSITGDYIYRLDGNQYLDQGKDTIQYPFPLTTVDQDIYRLGYQWKPADSRWIDLDVGLWQTDSRSRRYQNGDYTYQMKAADWTWDDWTWCNYGNASGCRNPALIGTPEPVKGPNTDDQYTVFIGNEIQTRSTRSGVDLSNRFRFSDRLALTATADWQYERQKDHTPVETSVMGMGIAPSKFGPASGRRQEYGAGAVAEWRATDRLQLSAGTRYGAYWAYDDELDSRRAERAELWKSTAVNTHQQLKYRRLVSDDEMATMAGITNLQADAQTAFFAWMMAGGGLGVDPATGELIFTGVTSGPIFDAMRATAAAAGAASEAFNDYKTANNITDPWVDSSTGLRWWHTYAAVPLQDGKPDSGQNPFHNGSIDLDETVENPQGQAGTFNKYQIFAPPGFGGDYVSQPSADPWKRPETQRAHAWSHMLAASYLLGERARVYARYSSMPRFPSILEIANRTGIVGGEFLYSSPKPERNDAWEVGYAYDLGGLLPQLRRADVKLSYFHNTIRDFYDRTINMAMIQFDRKIMSGVELQSRFDTGRFYGGLGATWRERQDMCDKDYAVFLDPHYSRLPECMEGGFPGTLSFASMQPRYSINLDLGARLLEHRLDLGVRLRYHSRTENKKLERLLRRYNSSESGYAYPLNITTGTIRPYYWQAVKLIDLYAEYRFDRNTTLRLSVENLTDRYYLDPLNRVAVPGPGRTVMLDAAFRF
ncbi:TonB-dependent receptor domain-containing protein [Pseudothauera rhizosphaerae]|nr:TonB-dependent receptor [Pseudothauera rhizosphaerae]